MQAPYPPPPLDNCKSSDQTLATEVAITHGYGCISFRSRLCAAGWHSALMGLALALQERP